MSPKRPSTWARIASRSNAPAIGRTCPLSAETQKWFDQNQTRRSAEADVGGERGIEPRLGFGEIELLRRGADGGPLPRRRVLWLRGLLLGVGRLHLLGLRVLRLRVLAAGLAAQLPLRDLELDRRARRRATAHQLGRGEPAGAGAVELGDQRAARIGRDRGHRSGARSETEPVQRQRRVSCVLGSSAMLHRLQIIAPTLEWMRFSLVDTEAANNLIRG